MLTANEAYNLSHQGRIQLIEEKYKKVFDMIENQIKESCLNDENMCINIEIEKMYNELGDIPSNKYKIREERNEMVKNIMDVLKYNGYDVERYYMKDNIQISWNKTLSFVHDMLNDKINNLDDKISQL